MKADIKKVSLSSHNESTELDFWKKKSFEDKLLALEAIRKSGQKLSATKPNESSYASKPRLRRVLRVIK